MATSHYPIIERMIEEYEIDKTVLQTNRMIIAQYPKMFVMNIMSSFEQKIKERITNIITHPLLPLSTYPNFQRLITRNRNKQVDSVYGKLLAYENAGIEILNATEFYNLFGGSAFIIEVQNNFNAERLLQLSEIEPIVNSLEPLLGTSNTVDEEYCKQEERREKISNCNFQKAETAFLSLKLRRNRVAHDYSFGLSDSFEDIRTFYFEAVLYSIALEIALKNKSTI